MLRITGGRVIDPANGIDGEVRDVCIADGRVVAEVDGATARTIDATGTVVFPGGVDVHTHVAGAALNFARAMTPENHRVATKFIHSPDLRAGTGGTTPTTFATGYLYAGMGYTTVNEAAVPVLSARHTHEELRDTPIVDKSSCVLMANNELLLDLFEDGETERAKDVLAWLVWAAKGYGVKAVNPGGVAAWKWGKDAKVLSHPIEGYSKVTPARIIGELAAIVDSLELPHPLHIHCNNLGAPGNISTTLETMRVLEGHRAHMAHLQFHAYGGDDWHSLRSEARTLAEYFNAHPNLTADAGAILFGDSVTITADGPWQHLLYQLTGRKWGNLDVENETGCGIVPYTYKGSNIVNAVQWAVGLELLLLIDDPWRIFLTTDHPNGACFWRYPEIIHLLMNADFRRERMSKLPAKALQRIVLAELDREYTLTEIATITSAGPARALGMPSKGHLGVGADADVTIYNDDPDRERMFGHPRYVLKGGEVVVEEGDIRKVVDGREFIVRPRFDRKVEEYLRPLFEQYYTVAFDNYPVEAERLEGAVIRELGGQRLVDTGFSMITLTLKEQPVVPLESEALSPDVVAKLRREEIGALPMFLGKRQCRVDDFFEVEGEASEELEIRGDASRVKWLGRGMTRGRLAVAGNAGMHLGAFMKGGTIEVSGNAGDWLGAEMAGGLIRIGGNAGGQIGAAYRGSLTGMTNGMVIVEGGAGLEVGMRMKRGTIVVKGKVRDFAGLEMKGGTLVIGGAELRTGAWMKRGTIVSLTPIALLPTFAYACSYFPTFLRLYSRLLAAHGVSIPSSQNDGEYLLHSGDTAVSEKGEILIWQPRAA